MTELDTTEISFINMIHFNRHIFTCIKNGSKVTDHFNQRRRKTLVNQGILIRVYGGGGGGLRLSEKATQALNNLKSVT